MRVPATARTRSPLVRMPVRLSGSAALMTCRIWSCCVRRTSRILSTASGAHHSIRGDEGAESGEAVGGDETGRDELAEGFVRAEIAREGRAAGAEDFEDTLCVFGERRRSRRGPGRRGSPKGDGSG